jgi:hypothetical protein
MRLQVYHMVIDEAAVIVRATENVDFPKEKKGRGQVLGLRLDLDFFFWEDFLGF